MKPPSLIALFATCALLASCAEQQSALAGLGPEADRIMLLSAIMFGGGGAIFLFIFALVVIALWGPASWRARLSRKSVVIGGGVVFPVVVLTALLFYGFAVLGAGSAYTAAENPLRVKIIGEQWWWRVIYLHDDGTRTQSANELRIPVGRVVEIDLASADVIHSFWIPSYAGKLDMVPGRTNTLHFVADEPGVVRGQCAEYCGGAHALMSFFAVAMEPEAFEDWLARERADATTAAASEGQRLFVASGCGGCHTIRGTTANGRIGPDLTHVGGRRSLGAGVLPNDEKAFAYWIESHPEIKPGTFMPPYRVFSDAERQMLARYLAGLE